MGRETFRRLLLFTIASTGMWLLDKVKALVELVLFHSNLSKSPTHKREDFLNGSASFAQK